MINNPFTPTQMIIGAASAAVLLLCVLVLPAKAKSNRAYVKIPSIPVSYTHLRAPRDRTRSRMPSSA